LAAWPPVAILVSTGVSAPALTFGRGVPMPYFIYDIPTVWLAGFVWETRLAEETSGPTRLLLLGALLVGLMIARPQGLLGRPRVEIV